MRIVKIFLKILGFALAAAFAFIFTIVFSILVSPNQDAIEERFLGESASADGKHVCSVYVANGGATTPYTVIAQVRGTWIIGKRTVYAVENIDEADFRWVDNRTIRINGVSLDIYKDYYGGDIYDLEGG